jgi:predicted N-acetyltransferase YhbS
MLVGMADAGDAGVRVASGGLALRRAEAGDLSQVHQVVVRAGLRSARDPAAVRYYHASPGSHMIVACRADRVIGVAFSIAFGATGWLGNVAVDPDARGQRVGTAVSAAAVDELRGAGVSTVVLTATSLGRPIYDRLGFVPDGAPYGIWQREPGGSAADGAVPDGAVADGAVAAGRFEDAMRLDAGATGQDRGAFLARLADRVLVPAGASTGYRLPLPWGGGPVIASDAGSARALLLDLIRTDPDHHLAFPESNVAGAELATSLGFRQVRNIPRLRLGPPVPGFRPERVFSTFSFAVG